VARHACFEHVLALGLVSQGAETDPRWNPGTNDSRRDDVDVNGVQSRRSQTCDASFTKLVRVTLHLRAAIGKARCDAREVWEGDLEVRRPQSLLLLQQACVGATEVMQHGSAGDESLYWLVKNATRVVKDAATLLIDSGNAFVALPSLVFSIRALESHALLATPAHLEWRLGLVKMTIACFDDVSPLTAVGEKSYAAGTTFLQKAKQSIEDLKQLEAMDATPMEPTRKRLYANADRLVMVMEASRGDAEKVTAFAEFLNAEVENETVCSYKPGDTNEHQMRSRQLVELLELTSGAYGPATSAVQTAASAWIAKRCDAAFVWYRHAEKVEAYEASKQTSADENTRDEEEDRTEEPEEGDAEGTSAFNSEASSEPPPKLSEAETAAYALTVFEFGDVSTHSALLRFSNAFAESHAFEALVMFGNYLLKEGQVKEGSEAGSKTSMETGLSAEKALRNSRLKQTVELLVALRLAEGRTLVGGDCEDGEKKKGEDEEENGETAEDSKKRTESTPQDHVQRLASAIKGVSPDSAKTSHCAESLLKGGLLLVDFCETKFEENAAGKAQTAYGFDVDEADTQIVTDALESASHAFESLDLRDHTLRASVLLKLSALYEKRGDGVSLRRADECATLASFVLNRARDDFVTEYCVGDPHEATKFLSAEAIWGDDTADKGSGFLKAFTPSTMSETQKRTACLAADAFSLSVKLQLVSSLEKRGVHVGGKKMELLPPDLLDELRTAAGDNHWEQAVVAMEAAACVGRERYVLRVSQIPPPCFADCPPVITV
jgi:predicted HNH restriction endonuclease